MWQRECTGCSWCKKDIQIYLIFLAFTIVSCMHPNRTNICASYYRFDLDRWMFRWWCWCIFYKATYSVDTDKYIPISIHTNTRQSGHKTFLCLMFGECMLMFIVFTYRNAVCLSKWATTGPHNQYWIRCWIWNFFQAPSDKQTHNPFMHLLICVIGFGLENPHHWL